MKIYGREVKFMKTVKGTCDLANLCPNHDLKRIGEVLEGDDTAQTQINMAKFIVAMNEGYEYNRSFEEEGYIPKPITVDMVLYLDHDVFLPLFKEASTCFKNDEVSIEAESKKKVMEQSN